MKTDAILRGETTLARGLVAVRAEAPATPKKPDSIDALATLFEDFKAAHNQQLAGKADAVLDTKVEAMNTELTRLTEVIEDQGRQIAAAKLNGNETPAARDPEYTAQFESYFRTGSETSKLNEVKAAATKTDGEGGYLAPIEWDRTVTGRLKQVSAIRQYASVQSIGGAGFSKVFSDRNVGSGWVGETAARPATATPALGTLAWTIGEIYANPAATQGLIDDAEFDVEQWLAEEVETEFSRQEGIAFLSGDGTNKPHGLLTYVTGAANAARHPWGAIGVTNSGNASTIPNGDAFMDLIYSLPEEYEANARLFMNRTTAGSIRKLKDGQGNYLWQPAFEAGQPASVAGVPVTHLPGMPVVAANAIAALYGDMRETYQVIDRIGIRVLRDPFTNKPFVHFYTTKRVGGGVKNPDAMKALKISA